MSRNTKAMHIVVILAAVGVAGCSSGGDGSPTAVRSLSPPTSFQHGSTAQPWSTPVNLGPVLNSAFSDQGPAISKNGLSLYFSSDRPGGLGFQDIWVAQREREDAPWGAPVNLGPTVNTAVFDSNPTLSPDGQRLFFNSGRPGGLGGFDIWVSFRDDVNDDFGWQAPVNLGAPINTSFTDAGPGSVRISGKEVLFFNSQRPGGAGATDIYASQRQDDGSFGAPTRVAELNSPFTDARSSVRHNGREIFFFSNRPGSAAEDIWTSTRKNVRALWSTPVNLGVSVNSAADDSQPALSRDGRTLFFASNRLGGAGSLDLYMTTRGDDDEDDEDSDDESYDESDDDSDDGNDD